MNPPSPRGRTQGQGHYVYIVQTIFLIFIKIKGSLFIPVYVTQSQAPVLGPASWGAEEGASSHCGWHPTEPPLGMLQHPQGARQSSLLSSTRSRHSYGYSSWRGASELPRVGSPHVSLAGSPGTIYFWIEFLVLC